MIPSMKAKAMNIKDCAILIGYNPEGNCVYNDSRDLADYYDGDHVWDSSEKVVHLRLQKVRGYLFNFEGDLDQEFESIYNLDTGMQESCHVGFADGTIHNHQMSE